MRTRYLRYIICAASIIGAQQAIAQNQNFQGLYVQGAIGYESSSPSVDGYVIKSTAGTPSAGTYYPTVSLSSKTFTDYSIGIGYGFRIGDKSILTLGVNINPQNQDYDARVALSGYIISPSTGTLKNRRQYFIAPGYELDDKSLIYAKLGMVSASFENAPDTANMNGVLYGIGYKSFFDKKMYYYGEINAANLSKSTVSGPGITFNGTFSYDVSAISTNILVGVGYKF